MTLFVRCVREDLLRAGSQVWLFLVLGFTVLVTVIARNVATYSSAPGLTLFQMLMSIDFLLVSFAGMGFLATVITEEKQGRTLALLRMTRLSPLAILLGKSSSRMLHLFLLLLAQFPFALLAITLGGVSLDQICACYASLLAFTFFVAQVGLLCSTVLQTSRRAGAVVCGVVVATNLLPWWFSLFTPGTPSLQSFSAYLRVHIVLSSHHVSAWFGAQFWTNVSAGLVLFVLAWRVFNFFNAYDGGRLATLRTGRDQGRGHRTIRGAPMVWKEWQFSVGRWRGVFIRLTLYATLFGLLLSMFSFLRGVHGGWDAESVSALLIATSVIAFLLELGTLSARVFGTEVRDKTLSALAVLPGSFTALMYGKVLASLLALIPAVVTFLIAGMISPESCGQFLDDVVFCEEGFYAGATCLLTAHLIAYLSLIVRRGAFLLGLAVMILWQTLFVAMSGDDSLVGASLVYLSVAIALQRYCLRRLRVLAAR